MEELVEQCIGGLFSIFRRAMDCKMSLRGWKNWWNTRALKRDVLTQVGVPWCLQRRVETLASTSKNQNECYVSVMDHSIIEAADL